jgi:CubicO group peptidase (beta-lactamase class C family)
MPGLDALQPMNDALNNGGFVKITSALVACNGELVHEFYADGVMPQTRHNTRSATKTVAGMLTGIAIGQGLIKGAEQPVLSFFAGRRQVANADPRKDAITIADLLTMSSALDCDDSDPDSPGNEEVMYERADWVQFALDLPVRPEPAADEPGREFRYCTAGVGLLGAVLVEATGLSVQKFAREYLFGPLGITGEQWHVNPAGLAFTGGGLELTSQDLVKLGQLYLDRGSRQGRQIVPAGWVAESVREHVRASGDFGYGYLWWLRSFGPHPAWLMLGNGGNKVAAFPSLGLVVVLTSVNYNTPGMHEQTERLLTEYILPAVTQ